MWCLRSGGATATDGSLLAGCVGRNAECNRVVTDGEEEEDLGPFCALRCTVHKVVVYRRQGVPEEPWAWDWILGRTKLLHVEMAPAGAEHRVKRTETGKLLLRKDGAEEDVWVWGEKASEQDQADTPLVGKLASAWCCGEELPTFDVQAGTELVLRVREGAADWNSRDQPLQLLGETTFTVQEDVLPAAATYRGDPGTSGGTCDAGAALDLGDWAMLSCTVSLPFVHRSRVVGVVSLTVRVGCTCKEEADILLERARRPSPAFLTGSCTEECVACDDKRGGDDEPMPTRARAVSKHWSPHTRFNRRFGGDQMAEETVDGELPKQIKASRRLRPSLSARRAGQNAQESTNVKTEAKASESASTGIPSLPSMMPGLPQAARMQSGASLQAKLNLHPPVWLHGHAGSISCCAVFSDGDRIVTGSSDRTARVWSMTGGVTLRVFSEHTARIDDCAVVPDGDHVLTIATNGVGFVWEASTSERLTTLAGAARCCQIFPNGERVLTALAEPSEGAAIFDLRTGNATRLIGHTGTVQACAVFPKGDCAVTVATDHEAMIWSAADGSRLRSLSGHVAPITCCAVSPKGDWLVTGSEDTTGKMWTNDNDKKFFRQPPWTFRCHLAAVRACAVVLRGEAALTVGDDRRGFIWSADGRKLLELRGHIDSITSCAVFPSGREVITSTSCGQESAVWSCVTGKQLSMLRRNRWSNSAAPVPPKGGDAVPPPPPDSEGAHSDPASPAVPMVGDAFTVDQASGDDPEDDEDEQDGRAPGICVVLPDGDWALTAWEDGTATLWPRSSLFGLTPNGVMGGPNGAPFGRLGYWTSYPALSGGGSREGAGFRERNVLAI